MIPTEPVPVDPQSGTGVTHTEGAGRVTQVDIRIREEEGPGADSRRSL
jgi:hypothetical protein